jgi:hypothetical protein
MVDRLSTLVTDPRSPPGLSLDRLVTVGEATVGDPDHDRMKARSAAANPFKPFAVQVSKVVRMRNLGARQATSHEVMTWDQFNAINVENHQHASACEGGVARWDARADIIRDQLATEPRLRSPSGESSSIRLARNRSKTPVTR